VTPTIGDPMDAFIAVTFGAAFLGIFLFDIFRKGTPQ
jgi:hypothetical protein